MDHNSLSTTFWSALLCRPLYITQYHRTSRSHFCKPLSLQPSHMDLSGILKPSFSPEAEELLQSLPRRTAWGDNLCLYKNSWLYPVDLTPTLRSDKNFQARDTDIFVVTLPKSGTTWLKSLVFAITRRVQYPISDPHHPLHAANSHELVPFFEFLYRESDNPDLSHLPSPRLFSTHASFDTLPESVKATKCRVIYLCRDQKDTLISLWKFVNKITANGADSGRIIPIEEALELYCNGITQSGPTWDNILGYWNASLKEPEKFLFLKYEDLKGDIVSQIKKIAEFSGCPFSAEEESEGVAEEIAKMCSFESLKNLQVNKNDGKRFVPYMENKEFFRKGEVGDWVNHMTPAMAERLDQIMEQKLEGSGLKLKTK